MNKKVLHVCLGNYYADGFGYQENLITKYQKRAGFKVVILASQRNYSKETASMFMDNAKEYTNEDGIKVIRIPYQFSGKVMGGISKILKCYDGTYEQIEKEKPDIIFLHNAQFRDVSHVIAYKRRNPNVQIYADNHADFINSARTFWSKNILHKIVWRYYVRKLEPYCEKFWGVTPNRCDFLSEVYGVANEKIELLPMGADSEKINLEKSDIIRQRIRKELQIGYDDFVLVTGGRIDKRKNIHKLLRAVSELNEPKIKLILIGVPNKEMTETINTLLDPKYARAIGWVNPDSIYDYFLASDLGVFPGTHSVLWEQAVGTGLPCIFHEWPGMTHVDIGGNCVFIKNGDVSTIKEAITFIFNDCAAYERMRAVSMDKGIQYFSYENISRKAIGL